MYYTLQFCSIHHVHYAPYIGKTFLKIKKLETDFGISKF